MLWEYLREEEFESAIQRSGELCVIVLGCLEKHGQHLPVGTDYLEAMTVVKEASKIEEAVIFQAGAWLGEVSCFHAFKKPAENSLVGCIGIKQSTILTVLEELCDEIGRNGFKKILIVNCHGGNVALLKHFIRCQSYEDKPYATMSTFALDFPSLAPMKLIETLKIRKSDFPYITEKDIETLKEFAKTGYGGGHADFRETALIMATNESLVAEDRYDAEFGSSTHRTDYLSALGVDATNIWLANYPNSYEARPPYGCSKSLGQAMVRICAERLAKIFKVLKEDYDSVNIARMDRPLK